MMKGYLMFLNVLLTNLGHASFPRRLYSPCPSEKARCPFIRYKCSVLMMKRSKPTRRCSRKSPSRNRGEFQSGAADQGVGNPEAAAPVVGAKCFGVAVGGHLQPAVGDELELPAAAGDGFRLPAQLGGWLPVPAQKHIHTHQLLRHGRGRCPRRTRPGTPPPPLR